MLLRSTFAIAAFVTLSTGLSHVRPVLGDQRPARPAGISSTLERAKTLVVAGDYAGAASLLEADPTVADDRQAEQYLGDLYVRLGRFKASERTYLALLRGAANDKVLHERLANAYAADDAIPEAIAEYQRSLPDVVAYEDLVRLHRRIGDLPAFVERYRTSSDSLGYGIILSELHRPTEAVPFLERAVADAPRSCGARTALGNAYLDLHAPSDAAYQFRECLSIDSTNYSALVDLGIAYDQQQQPAPAKALLDTAIRLRPDLPSAFVDYGYLADALVPGSGVTYYRQALANDVFSRDAYVDLGFDYAEQRSFALAEESYLKGLSVSPKDGRLEYLLGEAYSLQGKSALSTAQFAAAARSDDPEVARAAETQLGATH